MKSTNVYLKNKILFIVPTATTDRGVGIHYYPIEQLDCERSSLDIGEAILKGLENSLDGVPHPSNWVEVLKPLFKIVGVKDWKSFNKNSKLVGVFDTGTQFVFEPTKNEGSKKGYVTISNEIIRVDTPLTLEEIGQKVLECLSFSTDDNGGL